MGTNTKKINRKNPFKGFILRIELIALAVTCASCAVIGFALKDKNRYDSESADKTSFYCEKGFDLLISGASIEQVVGFDNDSNVSHVSKASKISLNVKTNKDEDYRDILVFDDSNSLEYSEFTNGRIIEKEENENIIVGVDYKFCQLYGMSLGDNLTISANGDELNLKIGRIYRTDYLYSEGVIVLTRDTLDFKSNSYYVYLNSNNLNELKNNLKDYKPMGTLLKQTSSQSNEDYQRYLDEFYAKDYSSCINDPSKQANEVLPKYLEKRSSANKRFMISIIVSSIIFFLLSFLCFFIHAKNKKDKIYKYIQDNGSHSIVKIFTGFNASIIVFVVVGTLITFALSLNGLTTFYNFASLFSNCYPALLFPIISTLVGYFITLLMIKKA